MLKGEPRGEFKKPPLGKPFIQGTIKKSSSPVRTAKSLQRKLRAFFVLGVDGRSTVSVGVGWEYNYG